MCGFRCAGIGMSCMKRLETVGESTDPCDTALGKCFFVKGVPLWTV